MWLTLVSFLVSFWFPPACFGLLVSFGFPLGGVLVLFWFPLPLSGFPLVCVGFLKVLSGFGALWGVQNPAKSVIPLSLPKVLEWVWDCSVS